MARHVEEPPLAEPPAREEFDRHQREAAEGQEEQRNEARIRPQGKAELEDGGDTAEHAQLAQGDETERHRPVGPEARILLEVLEFVGDAQLQEEEERGAERNAASEAAATRSAPRTKAE
ncbi:MAG TPA: hypothetical protein VLD36_15325 [Burkholderiales bacterium]|nr:hypothetical protein [Burkholderiales bacterium]